MGSCRCVSLTVQTAITADRQSWNTVSHLAPSDSDGTFIPTAVNAVVFLAPEHFAVRDGSRGPVVDVYSYLLIVVDLRATKVLQSAVQSVPRGTVPCDGRHASKVRNTHLKSVR